MKDLYKQLGVADSVGEAEIREAVGRAAAEVREAAAFILLDPARRAVYDRNRQVLVTVGRLRANLGLNLTRFWPRPRFADFTISLSPVPPDAAGRPIDSAAMAWAFGVDVVDGNEGSRRRRRRAMLAGLLLALGGAVCAALWYWKQAQ
jgi:hypothetical protein